MPLHDHHDDQQAERSYSRSMRFGVILLGFFIVAGFLLFSEHRAHVLGALFYLLPFVCLFMHMFMHGGHGGHGDHAGHTRERSVS
jgi:Protein of unknown function (DUF2933)